MNITVVGAGNMGLAMAGYMAAHSKGNITLFTKKEVFRNGTLMVNDAEVHEQYVTTDIVCTDDPNVAFGESDLTFVTYPAFLRRGFIEEYGRYFNPGSYLGFVPGYGGIEYACISLLEKGLIIFGFQRVPYVARAEESVNGRIAGILSKKKELYIGAIPKKYTEKIVKTVEGLLDIPAHPLKEYLAITLAPSNPLLHIVGLYNVFKGHADGDVFDRQLRFYEEWNDDASRLLFAYDAELQEVCRALSPLDMSEVVSLPIYYESPTPEKMTQKLKSIEAFKVVLVPLTEEKDGYHMDLSSRMFREDYPYGVCVIKDFAIMTGIETPTVDMLLDFYTNVSGHTYFTKDKTYTDEISETGVPGIHGLSNLNEVIKFYQQ